MADLTENLADLPDLDQVLLLEHTDNGPQSTYDADQDKQLPQDPGSEVDG